VARNLALEGFSWNWLSEGYFSKNVLPYGYIYQIYQAADSTGYPLSNLRVGYVDAVRFRLYVLSGNVSWV